MVDADDFLPAGELEPGDRFQGPNGELQTLAATRAEEHPEGVTVYNFEVENAHTYFVLPGEQTSLHGPPVLVHNAVGRVCPIPGGGKKPPKNFDAAREEAFRRAGLIDAAKVLFSKVDPKTGTVVEFKGPGGAKVGYDGPHATPGSYHDVPHISWQSAGKRPAGGGGRGNIPYSGPQHPSRPPKPEG